MKTYANDTLTLVDNKNKYDKTDVNGNPNIATYVDALY